MKTIIIVTLKDSPIRAFNNRENAVEWIKKMHEQYKIDYSEFLIHNVLMYE